MIEVSLLAGELVFAGIWLVCRAAVWFRQKKIIWKREALLLLMFINLAVLIRFVFFPLYKVSGHVQPLLISKESFFPIRFNGIPFVNIIDYEIKREAWINIIGNTALFIPTGIVLPILYKRLDTFPKVLLAGFGISFLIETIQLLFPGSVTDVDDLIMNTLGVVIGYGIYRLVKLLSHRGKQLAG